MEETIHGKLAGILRAAAILSPSSFIFAGLASPPLGETSPAEANEAPPLNPLITLLQQYFYQYCFCAPFTGTISAAAPAAAADGLLEAIRAANASRPRWDPGWQILRVEPAGQIYASKYGVMRMFWPGEFITYEGPGMPPRPGASVSVFLAAESVTMQPGFYFAFGETAGDQEDDARLVRFYWNITPDGLPALIRLATARLNRYQIPFRMKCMAGAAALPKRLDSAVLYANRRYYRITAELLAGVLESLAEHMGPETPLFTKRLAPGFALAEDPGNGESFGMHRCRILAEGVWSAYARGCETEEARLQEVARHFASCGVDLGRPYLNARSEDRYEFSAAGQVNPHG